jgi:hypothetical protein
MLSAQIVVSDKKRLVMIQQGCGFERTKLESSTQSPILLIVFTGWDKIRR